MAVVMINELHEDALEMASVDNEQPIEALGPNRSHKSLRNAIRLRDLNWPADAADAFGAEHLVDAAVNF
jgi:hypothetical protein